jgi:YNFM family putative membrane transporter
MLRLPAGAMYLGLGPHVLEKFGINGQGLNWIRIAGIPSMLLSIVAGNLIKRFGGKPILIFGLLLAGIGIVMEAITGSLITLVISSIVFVAGIASAIPGILVLIGQLGGNARGSALSLYAFFVFIGASLGPLLASYLMPYGFQVLGTTLGALLVLAAFISWQGIRMGKEMTETLRLET